MRQIISNILHYLMIILFILSFFALVDVGIQVSQFSNYRQTVDDNIARYGGLTNTAVYKINEYSQSHNKNRFSVISEDMGKKKKYGEIVSYQIKQEYQIRFLISKKVIKYSDGTVVSEVR